MVPQGASLYYICHELFFQVTSQAQVLGFQPLDPPISPRPGISRVSLEPRFSWKQSEDLALPAGTGRGLWEADARALQVGLLRCEVHACARVWLLVRVLVASVCIAHSKDVLQSITSPCAGAAGRCPAAPRESWRHVRPGSSGRPSWGRLTIALTAAEVTSESLTCASVPGSLSPPPGRPCPVRAPAGIHAPVSVTPLRCPAPSGRRVPSLLSSC